MKKRIEIIKKPSFKNEHEGELVSIIKSDLNMFVENLRIFQSFNMLENFSDSELEKILKNMLRDDTLNGAIDYVFLEQLDYDYAVEISFKFGVTDVVARRTTEEINKLLNKNIDSINIIPSKVYLFTGIKDKSKIELITTRILCNPLIENYAIFSKEDKNKKVTYSNPELREMTKPYYEVIDINLSDDGLIKLSADKQLSLTLEEMRAIKDHYNREDIKKRREELGLPLNPTDVELESIAQTWSEHCKHKIFAANIEYEEGGKVEKISSLFKSYIQKSTEIIKQKRDDLLSLFKDNAGVVKFNDKYAYAMKAETHNSPSALEPYGGAMTGILGCNRDVMGTGLGALSIFNTDVLCCGSPFIKAEDVPEGALHPRQIFRNASNGIKDAVNLSEIPIVNGTTVFDNSYTGKPLVFCGTGGLLPLEIDGRKSYEKYTTKGDYIVASGGRTGKDGIHGATFSSLDLSDASPTSTVITGDAILQKRLFDFLIEARDKSLFNGITDNGAGGFSCAAGEMGIATGGAIVYLEKVPTKYIGMKPWEILLSEAQERMTIAVPKNKIDEFLALSKKYEVESAIIGEFTDSGYFDCKYNGEIVGSIEMNMLHDGVPKMDLKASWYETPQKKLTIVDIDYASSLKSLLSMPNIASKKYWVDKLDTTSQGRGVTAPFTGKNGDGPSDGSVLKILPDSDMGLVVTTGIVPRYSKIDTYDMAACAIDEAFRSAVALGANPDKMVGLDNFCWPDPVESESTPDGKYKLAQLVRANKAIYDLTIAYNCPCVSGKDSVKNDYRRGSKKISILPTLIFTIAGIIDDVNKRADFYFKNSDSVIYLLGETKAELGASCYYELKGKEGGFVPKVDPKSAIDLYKKLHKAIKEKMVLSAHDLSDGGLAVALAESSFSGEIGADIDLSMISGDLTVEEKLFSESPSRLLVTVPLKDEKKFEEMMAGSKIYRIGTTNSTASLSIKEGSNPIINENIQNLKEIWEKALIF